MTDRKAVVAAMQRESVMPNTSLAPAQCIQRSLVPAFAVWALERHGIKHAVSPASELHVVVIVRRFGSNPNRIVENLEAFMGALTLVNTNVTYTCKDFALLTIREQLTLVASADVLVGVHGAGLTLAMYLPPWATLLQMTSPPGAQSEYEIFGLIAVMAGVQHMLVRVTYTKHNGHTVMTSTYMRTALIAASRSKKTMLRTHGHAPPTSCIDKVMAGLNSMTETFQSRSKATDEAVTRHEFPYSSLRPQYATIEVGGHALVERELINQGHADTMRRVLGPGRLWLTCSTTLRKFNPCEDCYSGAKQRCSTPPKTLHCKHCQCN